MLSEFECKRFRGPLKAPLVYFLGCALIGGGLYNQGGEFFIFGAAYFLLTIVVLLRRTPRRIAIHERGLVVTFSGSPRFFPWREIEEAGEDVYDGRQRVFERSSFTIYHQSGSFSVPYDAGIAIQKTINANRTAATAVSATAS